MVPFNHPFYIAAQIILRVLVVIAILLLPVSSIFHADIRYYFTHGYTVGWSSLPYRDFIWEYPPLSAVPLALIPLSNRNPVIFRALFCAMTIALEYSTLYVLQRARPQAAHTIGLAWTLTMLPAVAVAWFRLDFISVFLATLALLAVMHRRSAAAYIVAGFAAKLWPLVLVVPLIARRQWKDSVAALAGSAAVVLGWWAFSPQGFHEFMRFRTASGFQAESIPGPFLLLAGARAEYQFGNMAVSDQGLEWIHSVFLLGLIVMPSLILAAAWRRTFNVAALTGSLVCVAILCNRVFSAQYLTWLAPFVISLWPVSPTPLILFGSATWLSALILQRYGAYLDGNPLMVSVNIIRNLILFALMCDLLRLAFRTSQFEDSSTGQHASEKRPIRAQVR